ncbi:NHLP leader peptide family RiPP precursor [Paenibacillus sp. N4]|nr:NHLP leader peptide family RiPP precursor [Paenibacillus vietnamensis]
MSTEQSLKDQIIQKAWEDAEFKKQLLANPKAAVKDAFGVDVPDSIKVDVLEESADQYYLVIPQNPAEVARKADDEAAAWQ